MRGQDDKMNRFHLTSSSCHLASCHLVKSQRQVVINSTIAYLTPKNHVLHDPKPRASPVT